jgi:hypothetical protein
VEGKEASREALKQRRREHEQLEDQAATNSEIEMDGWD